MPIIDKPAQGPFTTAELVIITVPVLQASLLHALNMSTTYVALPNMQGNLSASPDQVGWIITSFVVASAVGGLPEVVVDGSTGFLCPPDDQEGFAARVRELLFDRSRARAMGRTARDDVLARFARAPIVDQYERLALDLCGASA